MPQIGLATFLKVVDSVPDKKIKAYEKYLRPGGYNFYSSVQECAARITHGGEEVSAVQAIIAGRSNANERKHNMQALLALQSWLKGKGNDYFVPPEGIIFSPLGHLKIAVRPEVALVQDGKQRIFSLWCVDKLRLSKFAASVGIALMRTALQGQVTCSTDLAIVDLRGGKTYAGLATPASFEAILTSEFALADAFFGEAYAKKKAA